jgi:hypothetical protein
MIAFNEQYTCTKCGSEDIGTRYRPHMGATDINANFPAPRMTTYEHLRVECNECGYAVEMACRDAETHNQNSEV